MDISLIHSVLSSLYAEVTTLDRYFATVDNLICEGDSDRYKTLVTTTVVGVLPDAKLCPKTDTRSFLFRQHEVVNRAVCRIAMKHGLGKHLLTLGYRQLSENPHALVSSCLDSLESTCPNWNVAALQSPTWEKLLSRIGNELMLHLIENTALFIAGEKCYIQISGMPVVNLLPSVQHGQLKIQMDRKRKRSYSHDNQAKRRCLNYHGHKKNSNAVSNRAQNPETIKLDIAIASTNEERQQGQTSESAVKTALTEGLENAVPGSTENTKNGTPLKSACLKDNQDLPSATKGADQGDQDIKRKPPRKRRRKKRHKRLNNGEDVKEAGAPYNHSLCADRRSLFYAKDLREQFPKRGLFKLESTSEAATELFNDIFMNCDVGETVVFTDSEKEKLKSNLSDLLLKLIKNHSRCPYRYLLVYYNELSKHKNPSAIGHVPDGGKADCSKNTILETKRECCKKQSDSVQKNKPVKKGTKKKEKICREVVIRNAEKPDVPVSVPVFKRGKKVKGKMLNLETESRKSFKKPRISEKELLQEKLCHSDMFCLLRNIIRRVIPEELFGSSLNAFMAELCVFVNLGRYERFGLGRLMKRIKDKPCKWVSGITRPLLRRHLVARFIWWLLTQFVIPVIKAFFYVTDSAAQRNRTLYFRKKTWKRLQQKTLAGYEATGMLKRISEGEVKDIVQKGQTLGVSTLRFLPKTTSLRPIVNMGKTTPGKKEQSINKKLQNLYTILADCQEQNPEAFGSSVFGLDDVYQRWKDFLQHRVQNDDTRPLFFVKVDIAKCYDTIRPQLVLDAVGDLLESHDETYVIRRWASVKLSGNSLKKSFHRNATTACKYVPNFRAFINRHLQESTSLPVVVSDQVFHHYENSRSLLKRLEAHLFWNVIQIGRQYYLQKMGISQGSVVSTQLCNLYYAHMERSILGGNLCLKDDCHCKQIPGNIKSTDAQNLPKNRKSCRNDELLMRMVDDFLFVSPYLSHAQQFLSLLVGGVPKYNCQMNTEKMLINFHSEMPNVEQVSSDGWLPWCGIQIHTKTLHVRTDYGRYKGSCIPDTMTFDLVRNPGIMLKQKLHKTVCAQCHVVCFDPVISSVEVISENLYRLFLLAAYKFHANARILPTPPKLNPQFFLSTILHLPTLVLHQIKTKLPTTSNYPVLQLEPTTYICISAFLTKLQKHQGGYQKIIQGLCRVKNRLLIDKATRGLLKNTVKVGIPHEFTQIVD